MITPSNRYLQLLMEKKIRISIVLILLASGLFAQSPEISFEHLNMRNGLANEFVGDILQDEKGYIWLNNLRSIAVYDGYHFKNYSINIKGYEGTANIFCFSMFMDKNKALWVTTLGGDLFRYDPVLDSLVLQKTGANKTGEGYVSFVSFADRESKIWSLTFKSERDFYLVRYDPESRTEKKYSNAAKGDQFFGAVQLRTRFRSPNGDVLLGARNGFYNYDFKQKRFIGYFTAKDSLNWLTVGGIYRERTGDKDIWLLANKIKDKKVVLYRFNLQTNKLKACINLPGDFLDGDPSIFEDRKGHMWLFTKAGLFLYDKLTNQKMDYLFSVSDKDAKDQNVRDVLVDKENKFWISTNAGLLNFDPGTGRFKRYKANQSNPYALGHIHVTKVFEDRSGLKWVGMDEYGVDRITNLHTAFTAVKNNPEKPGSYPENTTGIALKPDGNYWLTSQLGLFSWDVTKNLFTRVTPPGKKENAFSIYPQVLPNGSLCYVDDKGLNIYNTSGKIQTIPMPGKEDVSYIYKAGKSHISVLSSKGKFYMLNAKKLSLERYGYARPSGAPARIDTLVDVSSSEIYEDADGILWLSNSKIGLGKVDRVKKQVIISPAMRGKVYNDINKLYDDKAGRLWIGTNDNGFWQFDKKSEKIVRRIKDDQGVLAGEIRGIAGDKNGNVWIASQRGLAKYNYKTGIVLDYTIANNIPLEVPVDLLTLPDGRFVLCMFNSVLSFNPDEIKSNPVAPQVQVESVVYSNPKNTEKAEHTIKAVNVTTTTLPYDQNRVTFNYVGLHFVNPAQNKYAYMLENYDKGWIQAQTQRSVTYNNLAPGTYVFKVKAANSDGVWNNKGATYRIFIESPWWSRWWARVLFIVVFGSAVYGFIAYRSRRLIAHNKILEERITIRTHQLSEANEELQSKQDEITSQRDQLAEAFDDLKAAQNQLIQSEKMASLGELTAGIAHEIQNPLNFVNNFSEVSVELLEELTEEAKAGHNGDVIAIAGDLTQNLQKIQHHGKRADAIVKGMLQHSLTTSGHKEPTDLNLLANEYLRLAYHGMRAKDKSFSAELVTDFDEKLPKVNAVPQDIGRVMLNVLNNAFYVVNQKAKTAGPDYKPTVEVRIAQQNGSVLITVKDNGPGIPDSIKDKIMQPFFTTKPTGEGTGLGLSLSYDIVVKGHGGDIKIESVEGEGSEFIISLPNN